MTTEDTRGTGDNAGHPPPLTNGIYEDEISLRPLVRTLWQYRQIIATWTILLAAIFLVGSIFIYVFQPADRQASMEFRLIFDGANNGHYPNSLPFDRSEIIATPILTEVYESNELERYCTYGQFQNGLFILESNRELDLLGFEFQTKLGDSRLTPVDRANLEEEFRQRREALQVPQYVITFLRPIGLTTIPDELMGKVLDDILSEWADQAVTRRGVLNYQTSLYTTTLLSQELAVGDHIVRADILRGKINRFLINLIELETLPGISVVRVGVNRISLPEIRANLEDLLHYFLNPLTAHLWSNGLSSDANLLQSYVDNRLFDSEADFLEAEQKIRSREQALGAYVSTGGVVNGMGNEGRVSADSSQQSAMPALITQFGDSFLDRLISMAGATEDVQYRQQLTNLVIESKDEIGVLQRERAYYSRMNNILEPILRSGRQVDLSPELVREADNRFLEILDGVVENVEQANAVYEEVSAQNLNPRTTLFTITGPFTVGTVFGVTPGTLAINSVIALVVCFMFLPLICLMHNYFRQHIRPADPQQPGVRAEEEQRARAETIGT